MIALAAVWGFCEATVFFIVPDVLLSTIALTRPKLAIRASLAALGGALAGGALMWQLGALRPALAAVLVEAVPAISWQALADVRSQLSSRGWISLLVAGFVGTPYKIFAMEAGRLGLSLVELLLVSVPARLSRFLVLVGVGAVVARVLDRFGVSPRRQRHLLWAAWSLNYLLYWALKDW